MLANSKAKLLEIISTEFEGATQRQSEEDITRYFKLFPLLGEEQVGLDKYSQFVCAIVSGKAQASLAGPRKFQLRSTLELLRNWLFQDNYLLVVFLLHYF